MMFLRTMAILILAGFASGNLGKAGFLRRVL
jgi:hypothetical protein